jgi:hypothetical protein
MVPIDVRRGMPSVELSRVAVKLFLAGKYERPDEDLDDPNPK